MKVDLGGIERSEIQDLGIERDRSEVLEFEREGGLVPARQFAEAMRKACT